MPNRQVFIDALFAERDAFARFLETLRAESSALLRGDVDEVLQLVETKSSLVENLSLMGTARRATLADEGFSPDRVGMTEWLIVHGGDDHSRLSRTWAELLAKAGEARDLNKSNGVLIESRLRFNQSALTALRSAMQQSTLYGPDGAPDFDGGRSRALGLA